MRSYNNISHIYIILRCLYLLKRQRQQQYQAREFHSWYFRSHSQSELHLNTVKINHKYTLLMFYKTFHLRIIDHNEPNNTEKKNCAKETMLRIRVNFLIFFDIYLFFCLKHLLLSTFYTKNKNNTFYNEVETQIVICMSLTLRVIFFFF